MEETVPLFVLHLLGFCGFLWLGLYALTRGDRGRVSTLTGVTAILTSGFFFQGGLLFAFRGGADAGLAATIQRVDWWFNVAPVAFWLHLSMRLNPRVKAASWRRPALRCAYAAAAALTVLGTGTDLIINFDHRPVGAGPLFILYAAYLLALTALAVFNLSRIGTAVVDAPEAVAGSQAPVVRNDGAPPETSVATPSDPETAMPTGRWKPAAHGVELPSPRGQQGQQSQDRSAVAPVARRRGTETRLLVLGAVLFVLGAGYLALKIMLDLTWIELPAYALLLAGLAAVGASVAVQSALLLGRDVRRDFVYRLAGLAVLLLLYLLADGLLVGFTGIEHQIFALLLAGLITASDALQDTGRALLDRLFFTPVVREERAAARAYTTALATQPAGPHPDLATRKAFDDAVRRALTHLSDPTKLATTPLLNLVVVGRGVADQGLEDNRLNRAAVLKEIVLELLDGLRPGDGSGSVTGDAWRFYNCLYYPYVRGIGRRRAPTALRQLTERRKRDGGPRGDLERVLEWLLQVDEDTFYKWQRRGSDTIAAALREREQAAGGPVPTETTASARTTNRQNQVEASVLP